MTNIAEPSVARGVAWLDERYPDWFQAINLETLDIARSDMCILGQVYSGHVPSVERQELLAQVIAENPRETRVFGFDILVRKHKLGLPEAIAMGFTSWPWCLNPNHDDCLDGPCLDVLDFEALLEAWTQAIIQKRLEAQPETLSKVSAFWVDPSMGVGIQRTRRDLVGA